MIGWFVEVYKDDKALSAFAVVVFKNENDFDRQRKNSTYLICTFGVPYLLF